ncbi:MAG TPA: hypothetical protein VJ783_23690 [Pirellulales bacterium]|nr:hypothetical protein [Pirellulales bacterium]
MTQQFQFNLRRLFGIFVLLSVAATCAANVYRRENGWAILSIAVMFSACGGACGLLFGRDPRLGLTIGIAIGAAVVLLPVAALLAFALLVSE